MATGKRDLWCRRLDPLTLRDNCAPQRRAILAAILPKVFVVRDLLKVLELRRGEHGMCFYRQSFVLTCLRGR
jgi:hypothetical protein